MEGKTKKIILAVVVILIITVPLVLLSNPVLEKYQASNKKMYKKLVKQKNQGKDVSKKWESLKEDQKFLGDLYRITIRSEKAIDAYQKYHEWFIDDWEEASFREVKFKLAQLLEEIGKENKKKRQEYYRRAACHYYWITEWYTKPGLDYVEKSKHALQLRLDNYAKNCEELGLN